MKLGRKGFSVLELAVVLVVLMVLAATLVIRNPLDRIKLDSAASKVRADIKYARKLAISSQSRSAISFNVNGYSVYHDIAAAMLANSPGDACSTDASGNFVVDFTASRCSQLSGITLGATNSPVAFDSLGRPVDAAGTTLPDVDVTVTLNASRTITIRAQTGRVSE